MILSPLPTAAAGIDLGAPHADVGRYYGALFTEHSNAKEAAMSKRARKKRDRRKNAANHGKRANT
ncbi:hypothetical protein GCM10027402_35840 [Arthrobacter monumenti]